MIRLVLLFLAFLSSSTSHANSITDLCVADLKAALNPAGYPCKKPPLTVNDLVFSNFKAGNTSNILKASPTPAFVAQFPAVNGLGLSAARVDLDAGGVVPMHTHPGATEMVIMVQGRITTGFIAADNSVFVKTLKEGDIMVIPPGLLHFQVNAGGKKATCFVTYSSPNPEPQILYNALFGSSLDSDLVARTTFLDLAQVKKLKVKFGGSG